MFVLCVTQKKNSVLPHCCLNYSEKKYIKQRLFIQQKNLSIQNDEIIIISLYKYQRYYDQKFYHSIIITIHQSIQKNVFITKNYCGKITNITK